MAWAGPPTPLQPLLMVMVLLTAGCSIASAYGCQDAKAQSQLDLNKVTGQWYVVEIVEHDPKVPEKSRMEQRKCPVVDLHRQNTTGSWLSLSWTEDSDNVRYTLNVTDLRNTPGRWRSVGRQEGSMTRRDNWQHFDGVVLVLKAVEDHVVLAFCQHNPELTPYTLVLSRDRRMTHDDLESINNMVSNRKLYIGRIKSTCPNAAAAHSAAALALVAVLAAAHLLLARTGPS